MDEDLARCERKAGKRIRLLGQGKYREGGRWSRMSTEFASVIRKDGTLAAARQAMAGFNSRWLPDDR